MDIPKLAWPELIISLIVAVGLFFALRELFCWYYKINQLVKLQKENNAILRSILSKMPAPPAAEKKITVTAETTAPPAG